MSVVCVIDTVTEWARVNICDKILLKQPPVDLEAAEDGAYEYTRVHPVAFPMYMPTAEKNPPNFHSPYPSLCVRFMQGQDDAAAGKGAVDLQLCFSAWNPGVHGKDILVPTGDGAFKVWSEGEAEAFFQRSADGWRDAWNFADIALRAVESVTNIGGYAIDMATPIKFGPLTEQESIPDFYPYWYAWISFRVTYPLLRNNSHLKNFL